MQAAFMSAYQARYGDVEKDATARRSKKKPELTGITKLLLAAQDLKAPEEEQ